METACRGLRGAMIRALCIVVGLGIFVWFRPDMRRHLHEEVGSSRFGHRFWGFVHVAGLGLVFLPWISADPATLNENFRTYFVTLAVGAMFTTLGGMFLLLPPRGMWRWLRQGGLGLAAVMLVALFIPDLADALVPLWWSMTGLLVATFYGVAVLLSVLGHHVVLDPSVSTIGTEGFFVEMAGTCSGIEGFALTTGFFAIYAILMRDTLRQRRFWLIVFPLALLVSWLFNLIRIAALILIGAYVSPDLAVNGFHSFAGWLFFTVLALGVLWVVQALPSLHRDAEEQAYETTDLPPLTEDQSAAQIAPFIMFMLSGLLAHTFWQNPELGYPLQVGLMGMVLWVFRAPILALEWRLDPVALLAGAGVGVVWVITAPEGGGLMGLATLGPVAMLFWVLCRLMGTILLVPVIEEAFFRGYLLRWLGGDKLWQSVLAVVVSSLAFALLHGRIVEAGLAGVVFALVMLRKGRLADAILAHVIANAVVAAVALISGDWSLI